MRWSIFADLSRPLTEAERGAIFAAVDELIPDSGCVGPNRHGDEEVYFVVDASDLATARLTATIFMDRVIAAAGVPVSYTSTVQPQAR